MADVGRVKVGSETTYKVRVRGDRPFRILKVEGTDDVVSAVLPAAAAQNHVLELHCRPRQPGDLRRQLVIHTSLGSSVTVNLEAKVSP